MSELTRPGSFSELVQPQSAPSLYAEDFHRWTQETATRLRAQDWEHVDWAAVIEEIESLGISQEHAVRRRMMQILLHLLKWVAQPDGRRTGRSWRTSISTQRLHIDRLLERSPSLRPQLPGWLAAEYRRAVRGAVQQTDLPRTAFPEVCPWTVDQVLDDDFWPTTFAEG